MLHKTKTEQRNFWLHESTLVTLRLTLNKVGRHQQDSHKTEDLTLFFAGSGILNPFHSCLYFK